MTHAVSIKTHLPFNLVKVRHEARPLLFHGRVRADFISPVPASEDEGRSYEGADRLGHGECLADSRSGVIIERGMRLRVNDINASANFDYRDRIEGNGEKLTCIFKLQVIFISIAQVFRLSKVEKGAVPGSVLKLT